LIEKVNSLISEVGNGITEPVWADIDNIGNAVLKYESIDNGKKFLFNEYVCYLLAQELNIKMPLSGICMIDENTVCKSNDIKLNKILSDNKNKMCFYSKAIEKSTRLNEGVIREINDNSIFEKILLFDHVIYNTDRNEGNILITTKGIKELYVIDHSHVFKNQTIWDKYCFQQGMLENDYKDTKILDNNSYFYKMFFNNKNITKDTLLECAEIFRNSITQKVLERIFNKVPDEWGVDNEELKALKEYLMYRISHIDDFINIILMKK